MKIYRVKESLYHLLLRVIFLGLVVCPWAAVTAQTLTPEQEQQLKNLTPEQKKQLISRLGGSGQTATTSRALQKAAPSVVPKSIGTTAPASGGGGLKARDTLVIELGIPEDSNIDASTVRVPLGRHVYELDSEGYLEIPGANRVPVGGLSTTEAMLRLSAERAFADLTVAIYLLPIDPLGSTALKRYGHELFLGTPTTFAPVTDIPVPANYTLGPGDTISLLLFGQQNADYQLVIGRNGYINIPEIGPVAVAGMSFAQLREELARQIDERYIGVRISVTMGELRSIRVFVLGDVTRPGSYTVSSLSTMTNALFVSGGIAYNGTMRDVQLKRNNRVVGRLDLYDLLINGNTSNDLQLQPGDVIHVPPIGPQFSIYGQVVRPAIYELHGESELRSAISMAGGLLPSAFQQQIMIERFTDNGEKSVLIKNLVAGENLRIEAGDIISVPRSLDAITDGVFVKGHLTREITVQWHAGLRLLDVISSPREFRENADQNYLLIRRTSEDTGRTELLSANWRVAYENPGSAENKELQFNDTVFVFSMGNDRVHRISPLIAELNDQATGRFPTKLVGAQGWVAAPGTYPFEPGMRVRDLIRAAGSHREHAYLEDVEVTRLVSNSAEPRVIHISINLMSEDENNNPLLQPDDTVTIKAVPIWREKQQIEIAGEIVFPGRFSISRGERISDIIKRAGGLTDMAFVGGAVFIRKDLKQREATQLRNLQRRLRVEVASFSDVQNESRERATALFQQLQETEAVGRLVINLEHALRGDMEHNVVLEDGDQLFIPASSQEVTVIGEVQYPTSHIFEQKQNHFDYIDQSGGATKNADIRRVYVIRASGNVVANAGSNWFRRSGRTIGIKPGDTVVVPLNTDRINKLTLWSTVSQIVYNIGVSAAAVASF